MTDEAYVFQQDVKERKSMKTGAMHRKSGAKSKKCTLPSDHLTAKQKKKLNGECEIINLNRPLSGMDELRKYSVSLQTEYLQNCIDNYGARRVDLAAMLHRSPSNINDYFKRKKIVLNFPFTGIGKYSKQDERWAKFIENGSKEPDISIVEEHYGAPRKPEITDVVLLPDYKTSEPIEHVVLSATKPIDVQPVTSIRDVIQECAEAIIGKDSKDEMNEEPEIVHEELPSPLEETKEEVSGYSAVRRMKIDLKGTKAEIMSLMEAILGQGCNYSVKLDIINADKKNFA